MNGEQFARKIDDILRRLEILEARSHLRYDKGVYTPTYVGGTLTGTTTYIFQAGAWVRLGTVIVVVGQVAWSAATGTGEARISLPFTPSANVSGSIWLNAVTFANSTPQVLAGAGSYFIMDSPLTNTAPTRVQVEAGGNVVWQLVYLN